MELDQAIRRDTLAARPAATAVPPGTLYCVTDEGNRVDRSNGLAWEPYGGTGSGGGAPAAHHATHEPGGSDPMAVDAAPATGSLRTLGTGANQAAPGNDARFAAAVPGGATTQVQFNDAGAFAGDAGLTYDKTTDGLTVSGAGTAIVDLVDTSQPADQRRFRINTAAQHFYLTPMNDAGTASTGPSVSLTRLGNLGVGGQLNVVASGGNVALLDRANTFAAAQAISAPGTAGAGNALDFIDPSQPADQRMFRINNAVQRLFVTPYNDAGTAAAAAGVSLDRAGNFGASNFVEAGRANPLGWWQNVPYSAGNFTASGGSWLVDAGDVAFNRYSLVGNTLFWMMRTLASSLTGPSAELRVFLPAGLQVGPGGALGLCKAYDGTVWENHSVETPAHSYFLTLVKKDFSNWTAGPDHIYVYFSVTCEVL